MSNLSVEATPTFVPEARPAGWYPDPIGRSHLRHWSGRAWTSWVWDGTSVNHDPLPARRPIGLDDLSHLVFVEQVFLPEVCSTGALTPQQLQRMWELVHNLAIQAAQPGAAPPAEALTFPVAVPMDVAAGMRPGPAAVQPRRRADQPGWVLRLPAPACLPGTPSTVARPPVTPVEIAQSPQLPKKPMKSEQPPSALSQWWSRTRDNVGSDLAVHWLAYLGVLLFFIGAFGLVAFAFADVAPTMRWVAEIVIAAAPFLSAALLLSRGANTVGRALEVGGGLLLPVMVITSFLDGVAIPPDLDGPVMVATFTACGALIAAGYALWSRRHPSSGLRYLVAPMVWFTVAMATLGLGREIPVGKAVAVPGSAQFAAVAGSLVVTVVLARWRPRSQLAAPTLTAGVTGTLVIGLLAVLTWAAEDWPALPIALTGVLIMAAAELLRFRLQGSVADVAEPLWWAFVGCALVPGLGVGLAAAVAAAGFVILLESAGSAHRPVWALVLPAAGALLSIVVVWSDPWWAVGVLAAATGWAMVRRLAPFDVPRAVITLDLTAAILPFAVVVALGVAWDVPAAVACSAGLVLLATVPATRPVLHRGGHDRFWTIWWPAALVIAVIVAAIGWADASSAGQLWVVTMSVVALAIAAGVGPVPVVWRVWPVVGLATSAWLMACTTAGATDVVRGTALGVAALGLVVAAHIRQPAESDLATVPPVRSGVGLAGHVLALIAFAAGGLGWGLVTCAGLATIGWAVTTVFDSRDRSPVGAALATIGQPLRYLPPALVAIGMPITVALTLDVAGWLRMDSAWASMVLAATAVSYALVSRLHAPSRIVGTLAWGAFAAGIGASVTWQARPAAVGLAALILAVLLLPADRRVGLQTWVAWAALAPLVGLVVIEVSPWFAALPVTSAVAITLAGVGGTLLIGGAATDLHFGGWLPHYLPRGRSLWPVVVLGALELGAGLLLALLAAPTRTAGWVSAGAAIVLLVIGVLTRVGLLGGAAAVLGWLGALLVIGPGSGIWPWVGVVVVAGLLTAAELLHRLVPGGTWWSRWEASVLLAAVPVALTALAISAGDQSFAATSVVLGVECWAVALRLHANAWARPTLGVAGTGLILAGAAAAGSGWLALALLALSVGLTVVGVRTSGRTSLWFQLGGATAAIAAWSATLSWVDWTAQQSVDVTAIGAGSLAFAAACLALIGSIERSWVLIWGGIGVVSTVVAAAVAELTWRLPRSPVDPLPPGARTLPSVPVAVGLALVTAALLVAAAPLALGWLRDLGVAAALGTSVMTFQALDITAGGRITVLVAVSVACAVSVITMSGHPMSRAWQRPCIELGIATVAAAVWVAGLQLPDVLLLVPGLTAAALQAAVVGLVLRVPAVQAMSPVFGCAAWLVYASTLPGQVAIDVTAVGAGILAVAAAGLVWVRPAARWWVLLWGGAAVALVAGCATLTERGYLSGDALAPTVPVVVGLALVAAALLVGAAPLAIDWLRDLGVVAALGAAVLSFQSSDAAVGVQVASLTLLSVGCAMATFALTNHPAGRVWRRAVIDLGVGAVAVTTAVAALQLPDVVLLVLCLSAAAVQTATIGVVFRVVVVQCMSPLLACGAWLLYASAVLNGNPQWSTVPIGLALLVIVGLWRHDRVVHGGDIAAPEIVGLEFVGLGFLVGSSFAQAVTENVAYALLAVTIGLVIAEWGMTTQVRRRLISGIVIVLAALVVLVAVPLVRLLPSWGNAGLWVIVAGLGLVAVVAATTLERSRAVLHEDLLRFEKATADWE